VTDSDDELAVQKERIRRIVKGLGPNLEACFEEDAAIVKFVVKVKQFQITPTPVIASTVEILKKMADDDLRIMISLMSGGKV
jgi:hypothetical protein